MSFFLRSKQLVNLITLPFPFRALSGLRRLSFSSWESLNDDPNFLLSFKLFKPRFIIAELEQLTGKLAGENPLAPVVYFDEGSGFKEQQSVEAETGSRHILIFAPRELPNLRRIRLDPATGPLCFRIKVRAAYDVEAVHQVVARFSAGNTAIAIPPPKIVCIGNDPALAMTSAQCAKPRESFLSVADHYQTVLGLAGLHYGRLDKVSKRGGLLVSFLVPVYNTPGRYLDDLLTSFRIQNSDRAELILCDDGSSSRETLNWLERHSNDERVTILHHRKNQGIAATTNTALHAARGEWVAPLDHDDALSAYAVPALVEALDANPECVFLYTDEVIADRSLHPVSYFLKPAYDSVLLSGVNYINHLSLYRRNRLNALGGLRQGFDGSQDYDLLLRYLKDVPSKAILHLPFPAYIWRRDGQSYSVTFIEKATANARKALAENYANESNGQAVPALVEPAIAPDLHRIRFDHLRCGFPKISIIIPNKNSFALICRLLSQLDNNTFYSNLEIIIVDNGSTDQRVLDFYKSYGHKHPAAKFLIEEEQFNFSRAVNKGMKAASGDFMLLLNNDIEVIEPEWLTEMAACFSYPSTGIVGARLLYPSKTIQHAGVIVGLGNYAGHWFLGSQANHPGPMSRLLVRQSLSAVTGACMLISRRCMEQTGLFDEEAFAIAYNDIDYCLRASAAGFRVVYTPFATLIHHESISRGSDETKQNKPRFDREKANLEAKYATSRFEDKAFNPWYTRNRSVPALILRNELPPARTGHTL